METLLILVAAVVALSIGATMIPIYYVKGETWRDRLDACWQALWILAFSGVVLVLGLIALLAVAS